MIRSFKFIAVFVLALSAFSAAATAQAPASSLKIALINTQAFYGEKGITKYKDQNTKLNVEFKADRDALNALLTKRNNLQKEIQAMLANKNVPVNQKTMQDKQLEFQKLSKEFEYKKDDFDTRVQRRQQELLGPVNRDVGQKIEAFAKSKGFDLVFDVSNLARDGSILYLAPSKEITQEFITYYNALPAGTAAK